MGNSVLSSEHMERVTQEAIQAIYEHKIREYELDCTIFAISTAPHKIYQTKVTLDGNMYCCLYGDDLQSGIAGFGETPKEACAAFDKEWETGGIL